MGATNGVQILLAALTRVALHMLKNILSPTSHICPVNICVLAYFQSALVQSYMILQLCVWESRNWL